MDIMDNNPIVLGEGSYGCVLQPPLPCKTGATIHKIAPASSSSPKQVVGKIMSRKDTYNTEVAIAKVIAKIDPESKYFLYPTSACEIEPSTVPKCKLDDEARYQLIMPYGGIDLREWLDARRGSVSHYQIVEMLLPIFEAVVVLSKAGYCHQDIKVYNILVPGGSEETGARLIDNSLTLRLSAIYDPENLKRRLHKYFPYPPEYRLLNYIVSNGPVGWSTEGAVAETLKNILSKSSGRYFFKYHDRDVYKNAIVDTMKWLQSNIFAISAYADRVDVYSVGAVLIYSHRYLKKELKNADPAYAELIAKLTDADPRKRLSPVAALKAAKAYLSAVAAATAEAAEAKVRKLLS